MKALLPNEVHISQVHLRTANLKRALAFYLEVLGLQARYALVSRATLSTAPKGPESLVLSEDVDSPPRPPRSTGLYHFALRYPSRQSLARVYQRLAKSGYPVAGAADHGVSEALYLSDPDGNGVELYADRPRAQWRWHDGQVAMTTRALDLDDLLATAGDSPGTPEPGLEAEIGHLHLQVADLAAAERFYADFLGLSVTQRSCPGALFFAAGGYHHHLAVNVWGGPSASPAESIGLVSYRFQVPCAELLYCLSHRAPLVGYETRSASTSEGAPILQIRDPNGTWLEVQPSPAAVSSGSGTHSCADQGEAAFFAPAQGEKQTHQETKLSHS
jgi:catechol 2,3-dioxygenase